MNNTVTVAALMKKPAVTMQAEDSLAQVRDAFESHPVHSIPIMRGCNFLGLIHRTDFKFFMAGLIQQSGDSAVGNFRLQRIQAQDIMTTGVDSVSPGTPVEKAINLILEHHFEALPVVENNELAGIITPFDVLEFQHNEATTS